MPARWTSPSGCYRNTPTEIAVFYNGATDDERLVMEPVSIVAGPCP